MTVQISLKRNDWIFRTGPWFSAICVLVHVFPNIWTFWLRKCFTMMVHLPFWPGCLQTFRPAACSVHPGKSWCNVHYFCSRHLWRRWSLLSKYCIQSWIISHDVTAEYNSTFCISETVAPTPNAWNNIRPFTTQKCTILHSSLASTIISFLFLTFVSCHASIFSSFSYSLSTAAFTSGIFIAWGMGINLCTRLWWLNEFSIISAHPGCFDMTSIIFAAVICDADDCQPAPPLF